MRPAKRRPAGRHCFDGMIRSGWEITSTWPIRSERGVGRAMSARNALASSIVLSLRPRPDDAPTTDRRGFIAALEAELPDALRKLQQGQIAPVDLPQAAIGPGMAVFSRYSARHRSRWLHDDRSLCAGSDQRDPRPGAQ